MELNADDIDPKKTAVVVIDLQNDFCHERSVLKTKRDRNRKCAEEIYKFIKDAENNEVKIIFSQQIFDKANLTWRQKKYYANLISGKRKVFGAYKGKMEIPCKKGTFGARYFNYDPPKNSLFTKANFDIWQNKKLIKFLDKNKIETLIITGVEVACCVLYAVLGAEERGFNVVIPRDLVSGVDEGLKDQTSLLKIINEMYGPVVNSTDIIKIWKKNAAQSIKTAACKVSAR